MSATARAPRRLRLQAIAQSLTKVQQHFAALGELLLESRDPFIDHVRDNMLAGYALVDDYVARGIDLFALQNVGLLLEINATVLCGTDPERRANYAAHLAASEKRFFAGPQGGASELLEWYDAHRDESIWKRAAGVYIHILAEPQLFIEGNHRSASLLVSYLQMRDGYPPFVLSLANAEAYFNPSTLIRRLPRHGIEALLRQPAVARRYARFLEQQALCAQSAAYLGTAASAAHDAPPWSCFG